MNKQNDDRQRFEELKADRAVFGLSDTELAELMQLSDHLPDDDLDDFERVAAAVEQVLSGESTEAMPDHVRVRLEQRASEFVSSEVQGNVELRRTPDSSSQGAWRVLPWLVAAASVALAVFAWNEPPAPPTITAAEMREQLLASASDVVQADWTPGTTPVDGATGDVVWSPSHQKGFMRFRNFVANEPTKEQYQLWIFDKSQDEATPIDGGVFDVGPGEEVVVAIDAKLRADDVYLFAVTIEKPGGVVVSTRERLPLLAKVN